MEKILGAFARNTVFANIVLATVVVVGVMAAYFMVRESFPTMERDRISISLAYPGADPEEVEEGISRKIEEAIEGLEGVKEYSTISSENVATASIEVKKGYDTGDVLENVKTRINAIATFPKDAEKPVIKESIRKSRVLTLYLASDMPERRLKEWGQKITDRIKELGNVSQVSMFGARAYEIAIEVSEEKLLQYNLTFDDVADAVRNSSVNRSGGTLKTIGEEIRLRTMGRKYTGRQLAKVVVQAQESGQIVTLDRIATIVDGFEENPARAYVNGKRCVLIMVSKTDEEDALNISWAVNGLVDKIKKQLPTSIELRVLYDRTTSLKARINLLTRNGSMGLVIVFVLLWAFLNTRLSIWVGMGIPISLAGGLGVLWAIGGTINMISLFGFILVLGIVVDDAIVVGESIYVHRKQGKPPLKAAIEGTMEVAMPVTAAVLTSIVAFIPLGFVEGTMGKFIAILPSVVISCLFISLIDCFILLPAHLNNLDEILVPGRGQGIVARINGFTSQSMEWFVLRVYTPFLSRALHFRYLVLCTAIAVLLTVIGIVKGGLIKYSLFPQTDGYVITASIAFPEGTPAAMTELAMVKIEKSLRNYAKGFKTLTGEPLIKHMFTFVGASSDGMTTSGPHAGMVQAILLESEKRGVHSKDILFAWEENIGSIPGAESLTFQALGPGARRAPLAFEMHSDHVETLVAATAMLKKKLGEFAGVYQVKSDMNKGKKELRLSLKPEARSLGITVADLASQINSGFYGNEAQRLQRGEHDVRVKIRYTKSERSSLEDLQSIRIRTPKGEQVPLRSVAHIEFEPGFSAIRRTNGKRSVLVTGFVNTKITNANEIFEDLGKGFLITLKEKFPDLLILLQGDKKRSRESMSSLKIGFPIALMGIFTIVATMFRSYLQPFIIMVTIPFGVIGAVLGHMVMGYSLSMMSLFGMVALTGVVVNDAIVLVERINENFARNIPFFEAILRGGSRRFRAIFLTTLSTVGGLGPMLLETDLQAQFLIPMAISLAAGVLFATVLTLVLIPCLLVIFNDFRLVFHRVLRGVWPESRTLMEPSSRRYDHLKAKGSN
ncbi:MAG: efflux RND transporter permease subunit [Desulfobacteraceae bacterium]|nr:efflux RND transporter permease subunit [Desulfobacteraceae bacterium]